MMTETQHYQPEIYSKEQLIRWESGANNFIAFWQNIRDETDDYDPDTVGCLQAMFLGEKPAIFHGLSDEDHKEKLRLLGFESVDNYTYDPNQVAKVMKDYPNEFSQHNLDTPEELMIFLDKAKPKEHSVIRGLVLGFPYEATRSYNKMDSLRIGQIAVRLFELLKVSPEEQTYLELNYFTEKRAGNVDLISFFKKELEKYKSELHISDDEVTQLIAELHIEIETRIFGAYGVSWVDSSKSEESVALEKRIRDAFEKSGILNAAK